MTPIKSYTDLQQSKRLAEILPFESADMCYDGYALDNNGNHPIRLHKPDGEYDIPCWSLAALLDVLDFPSLTQRNENEWEVCVFDHDNEGEQNSVWSEEDEKTCVV